jgi:hypothetical protein
MYYSLLKWSSHTTLVPVLQDGWMAIFRESWLRPGQDDGRT